MNQEHSTRPRGAWASRYFPPVVQAPPLARLPAPSVLAGGCLLYELAAYRAARQ